MRSIAPGLPLPPSLPCSNDLLPLLYGSHQKYVPKPFIDAPSDKFVPLLSTTIPRVPATLSHVPPPPPPFAHNKVDELSPSYLTIELSPPELPAALIQPVFCE